MSKLTDRLRLLIETQAPTWQHSFLGGALPAGARRHRDGEPAIQRRRLQRVVTAVGDLPLQAQQA